MSFFARAILFLPVVALLVQSAPAQTLEWVRSGSGLEDGGGGFATDIAVDVAGSVYTTGTIILDTDFDGDGVADGFDSGSGDIFVAKYSGDGDLLWVI
ncbi:MAG: hypothetical protein HKN17_07565, partial [Rhodothermales bacterium]|nr:hypothetical protein [Rhodothermales bacterium]